MNSTYWRLAALIAILTVPCSSFAAIKCWTNKQGVRECGNTVPPEYAQQETRTLNQRGVTVDVKQRAKTPEELERERAAREEEERRQAEERQRQEEQANYDRMLLATFSTEEELERARERSVNAIDATIDVTNATIATLNRRLEDQQRRAGKEPSEAQKDDIAALERQIEEKQAYVDYKQREKDELLRKYDADLKRFRELKATRPQ